MRWLQKILPLRKPTPSGPTPVYPQPPPLPEDAAGYGVVLDQVLDVYSDTARAKIIAALHGLLDKAAGLDFGGHPSQEADGSFDVIMPANGPELSVLNKAIAPHWLHGKPTR